MHLPLLIFCKYIRIAHFYAGGRALTEPELPQASSQSDHDKRFSTSGIWLRIRKENRRNRRFCSQRYQRQRCDKNDPLLTLIFLGESYGQCKSQLYL
jgi:hypothetical protein